MSKKGFFYFSLFIISTLFVPAYAYAGPGSAIGILLVILTVLLAFFGSVFLKFIKLIKKIYFKIENSINRNKKIKKDNVK